jgi:hypothetical protein
MNNLPGIIVLYNDTNAGGTKYLPNGTAMFAAMKDKSTYTHRQVPQPEDTYQGYLGALDETSAGGGVNGYCGVRFGVMLALTEMIRSAITLTGGGQPAYADTSAFLQHVGAFWQHRLRSDNVLFSNVGKSNPGDNYIPLYEAWAGMTFGDSAALGMAHTALAQPTDGTGPMMWDCPRAPWILLWYKPWLPYTTYPPASELSFIDPASGVIMARDRWFRTALPYSATTDTTTVMHFGFVCGPNQSGTPGNGHIYVSRGRKPQLNGANGYADTDEDLYFYVFGQTSEAYNTLAILKPGETIGTCPNPLNKCGGGGSIYPTYPEDGQQVLYLHNCESEANEHYPKSAGTYGYLGEFVSTPVDTGGIVYGLADMTAAYKYDCTVSKASSVLREAVFIRGTGSNHLPILVVRDRVTRLSASYDVRQRWHVIPRPEIATGSCSCVDRLGAPWDAQLGGVYEAVDVRNLSISRIGSETQMVVLEPRPGSGAILITGGSNSNDEPWQQTWQPTCDNYDPVQTSYEFWVAGQNYCGMGDPKTRRTTPGVEASDWTIEVQAPASGTNVEIITVFVFGPDSQPTVTARLEPVPGSSRKRVVVRQGISITDIEFETASSFISATRRR